MREGATETAAVTTGLLSDLVYLLPIAGAATDVLERRLEGRLDQSVAGVPAEAGDPPVQLDLRPDARRVAGGYARFDGGGRWRVYTTRVVSADRTTRVVRHRMVAEGLEAGSRCRRGRGVTRRR